LSHWGALPSDILHRSCDRLTVADLQAPMKRFKELRLQFDKAHAEGLRALETGDFRRLGAVIRKEGEIIDEQGRIVDSLTSRSLRNNRRPKPASRAKEP
jgi:hypothetical protein